LRIENAKV